jgi:hypothetical protein
MGAWNMTNTEMPPQQAPIDAARPKPTDQPRQQVSDEAQPSEAQVRMAARGDSPPATAGKYEYQTPDKNDMKDGGTPIGPTGGGDAKTPTADQSQQAKPSDSTADKGQSDRNGDKPGQQPAEHVPVQQSDRPIGQPQRDVPASDADVRNAARDSPSRREFERYVPEVNGFATPLTKERLDELGQQKNIGADKTDFQRERAIGRWFQDRLLIALNLPENGRQFPTMARDLSTTRDSSTVGDHGYVTPDGVVDVHYWRSSSDSPYVRAFTRAEFYLGLTGETLKDSTFYEFKALKAGTTINLSDSVVQIKGLIDAASQTAATRDPKSPVPSSIHFGTTEGVKIGDDVVAYARSKDVLIVQHVAEEVKSASSDRTIGIRLGAGVFLNGDLVSKRGATVTSEPSRTVSLGTPNLVRVNLLR